MTSDLSRVDAPSEVVCPFTLRVDHVAAMLNMELPDHPVYDGLELQWFDDEDHGTGMLFFLSRRGKVQPNSRRSKADSTTMEIDLSTVLSTLAGGAFAIAGQWSTLGIQLKSERAREYLRAKERVAAELAEKRAQLAERVAADVAQFSEHASALENAGAGVVTAEYADSFAKEVHKRHILAMPDAALADLQDAVHDVYAAWHAFARMHVDLAVQDIPGDDPAIVAKAGEAIIAFLDRVEQANKAQ